VDVHFYPWVYQYEFAGLGLEKYPNVKGWLEGVKGLDAVGKAYEKVPKGEKA
jgi:glutathione S-transferase